MTLTASLQMVPTAIPRITLTPLRCVNARSLGSEARGQADPNQPMKPSIADRRTQGNIRYWFGSAAVQQNIRWTRGVGGYDCYWTRLRALLQRIFFWGGVTKDR